MKHQLGCTIAIGFLLVTATQPVAGQRYWTELSTIGYGGIGVGTAIAACRDCSYGTFGILVLSSAVIGTVIGYGIGRSAETTGKQGEWPSERQLLGARIGTVAGVATLGAVLTGFYIQQTSSNGPGDDERMLFLFSVGGGVLGALLQRSEEGKLRKLVDPEGFSIALGPGPTGGVGVGVRWIVY